MQCLGSICWTNIYKYDFTLLSWRQFEGCKMKIRVLVHKFLWFFPFMIFLKGHSKNSSIRVWHKIWKCKHLRFDRIFDLVIFLPSSLENFNESWSRALPLSIQLRRSTGFPGACGSRIRPKSIALSIFTQVAKERWVKYSKPKDFDLPVLSKSGVLFYYTRTAWWHELTHGLWL